MAALRDFRSEVLTDMPECPTAFIDRAVRHAAIEFCDYTLTWRQEVNWFQTIAGIQTVDLDADPGSRIVAVLYVGHDGMRVLPATERKLDTAMDGWRNTDTQAEVAEYYYLPDRETLRLALTPSTDKPLTVTIVLKPTQNAVDLPDTLYEDHLEAIGNGAKARLFALPRKPWTDGQLAGHHRGLFERAKKLEKAARLNDYTRRSTLSVQPFNYNG